MPDELLSNAHALMVLAPDDPRRERIYLAGTVKVQMAATPLDDLIVAFVSCDFQSALFCERFGFGHRCSSGLDTTRTKSALRSGSVEVCRLGGLRTATDSNKGLW